MSFFIQVFSLTPNEQSFMTFLLTRSDTGITSGGIFTIGTLKRAKLCYLSGVLNDSYVNRGGGFCSCGSTLCGSATRRVHVAVDDFHGWC